MIATKTQDFQFVRELLDSFLSIFAHRHDFIWASHPEPGEKAKWQTETRYPLSDRALQQSDKLYGVRFGAKSDYLMLDVDRSSAYHPTQDRFAVQGITQALEPLGCVSHLCITSSHSKGLHLYFPLEKAQNSWAIGLVATVLLERAGFKVKSGQLEVFPNPKSYTGEGTQSLYNAHRLPLQPGSQLLNEDWQPVYSTQALFVQQWQFAQRRNEIDQKLFNRILKQARPKAYRVSGRATKFLNDLNNEIEPGWTDSGQTNHLLGRIAMWEYIFGHIRRGGSPLAGEELAEAIAQTARSLPGYEDFCNHQSDLEQRAAFYARSIEASRYYPYGYQSLQIDQRQEERAAPTDNQHNQQQSDLARQRIVKGIQTLLELNALPSGINERCQALEALGLNRATLYRHRDIWHPKCLTETLKPLPEEEVTPIYAETEYTETLKPLPEEEVTPVCPNKLVEFFGSAAPSEQDGLNSISFELGGSGGNFSDGIQETSVEASVENDSTTADIRAAVQQRLDHIKSQQDAAKTARLRQELGQTERNRRRHQEVYELQLQEMLSSGDPILVAEAKQRLANRSSRIEGDSTTDGPS